MRVHGALASVVVLQYMSAAAAGESVLGDLFYTTGTPCAALRTLPTQHDLRAQLLPESARFAGSITLSKSDAIAGCVLHLALRGELADGDGDGDVFALAHQVDASLAKLLNAHSLRGTGDQLKDLAIQRLRVKVGDRDLAMDAHAVGEAATGELTLNGDGCDGFAGKRLLDDLLGDRVGEVAVVAGQVDVANCAIDLDIMGRAPVFGSTPDALAFLRGVDASLSDWFGATATKQSTAKLRSARLSFSPAKSVVLEASAAQTAALAAHGHVNAPTKQITMGILMGLMMLTAMLVGIAYQKKRHEQSQQLRHDNASRAAQIRRVSYRMGYEPVRHSEAHLDAEEEEKDGLL